MLRTIFAQETKAEAEKQWQVVADALREKNDGLARMMDASREDVLAYMDFPREHWGQIASTNPLERLNKELKRRSDVVGTFPKDKTMIRLVGALMLEQNDEWAVARRYTARESLARIVDDHLVRLSAVAPCSPSGIAEDRHSYTTPRDMAQRLSGRGAMGGRKRRSLGGKCSRGRC